MKIISLKYDVCMKELFRNEEVLRYFLSAVLAIPVEKIKKTKLLNPFLWKKYRNQKLGIVDVLVELNDNTKINIEMQLKTSKEWDKRQLFYLSKIYAADLHSGEDYSVLKRCVGISILDFNLTDREEYHSVYKLRDKDGNVFSDMMEIHTLELRKKLKGNDPLDDWIRLFNAESEADLDMIRTKNEGMRKAVEEVRVMSLRKNLRALYEAHLKEKRDRRAREAYVREEGIQEGIQEGIELTMKILQLSKEGVSNEEIAKQLGVKEEEVRKITKF